MEDGKTGGKILVRLQYCIDNSKEEVTSKKSQEKSRYLALFMTISQTRRAMVGRLLRWRLASMVKESLITILKEISCYGCNFPRSEFRSQAVEPHPEH
jgi:hypothetical protein